MIVVDNLCECLLHFRDSIFNHIIYGRCYFPCSSPSFIFLHEAAISLFYNSNFYCYIFGMAQRYIHLVQSSILIILVQK